MTWEFNLFQNTRNLGKVCLMKAMHFRMNMDNMEQKKVMKKY